MVFFFIQNLQEADPSLFTDIICGLINVCTHIDNQFQFDKSMKFNLFFNQKVIRLLLLGRKRYIKLSTIVRDCLRFWVVHVACRPSEVQYLDDCEHAAPFDLRWWIFQQFTIGTIFNWILFIAGFYVIYLNLETFANVCCFGNLSIFIHFSILKLYFAADEKLHELFHDVENALLWLIPKDSAGILELPVKKDFIVLVPSKLNALSEYLKIQKLQILNLKSAWKQKIWKQVSIDNQNKIYDYKQFFLLIIYN